MLRRSKTINFDNDPVPADSQSIDAPARPVLRRNLEALRGGGATPLPQREDPPAENPVHERFDFLRSELDQAPISKGAQESLAALREDFRRRHVGNGQPDAPALALPSLGGIRFSRVLLLGVAIIAGGIAGYLALNRPSEPAAAPVAAPEPVVVVAPTLEILVARTAIPVGARLTPDLLEWQKWPEETVRAEYITSAGLPDAMDAFGTSVARAAIIAGEPIRREKLGAAGTGYLSAILEPGKRAVSVAIDARTASGGFIAPDDRVDVVLTRMSGEVQSSRTILTNVRVIAINARLGGMADETEAMTPQEGMFENGALATLELDPTQAELIINATGMGALSLMLRPMTDTALGSGSAQQTVNQSIRMTSPFWLGMPPPETSAGVAPRYSGSAQ